MLSWFIKLCLRLCRLIYIAKRAQAFVPKALQVSDDSLEFMIACSLEKGKFSDAAALVPIWFRKMAAEYRVLTECEPTRRILDEALAERLDVLRESAALKLFARAKEHASCGLYNHDEKRPMHHTMVIRAMEIVQAPIGGYTSQTARYDWIPRAALQLDVMYESKTAFSRTG